VKLVFFDNRFLRTRHEEFLSALIHSYGAGIACAMTVALGIMGSQYGPLQMWSGLAYGVAHIITYSSSVAYHFVEYPPLKTRFRALDQAAIYVAISGTFTPILLLGLPGAWGPALAVGVWITCSRGAVLRLMKYREEGSDWVSLLSYLGFAAIGALLFALVRTGPIHATWQLFGGSALLFGVGLVFYMWHYRPYFHTAWHIMTILGHLVHFYAVWHYFIQH
jgi:hemolysin III